MENSIKAIAGGISYVQHYHKNLFKALLIPVLVLFAIVFLPGNASGGVGHWIGYLQWIPLTLIAITTHKMILEGPQSVPVWGINRFGLRELKFFGYQIFIVLMVLPVMAFVFIPHIGIYIASIVAAYVIGRLSLVFPAIAVNKRLGFGDSWAATKNHQLMMLVVVILFPLSMGLVEYLLELLTGQLWLSVVFSTVTTVFVVASLSVAYKIIIEAEVTDPL